MTALTTEPQPLSQTFLTFEFFRWRQETFLNKFFEFFSILQKFVSFQEIEKRILRSGGSDNLGRKVNQNLVENIENFVRNCKSFVLK